MSRIWLLATIAAALALSLGARALNDRIDQRSFERRRAAFGDIVREVKAHPEVRLIMHRRVNDTFVRESSDPWPASEAVPIDEALTREGIDKGVDQRLRESRTS